MGWNEILDKLTVPKETNRQIGPLFKKWIDLKYLGANITKDANIFLKSADNIRARTNRLLRQFRTNQAATIS